MKPLAMFAAALTLAMFAGCEENAVEPTVANGAAKPDAPFRTMMINEEVEVKGPDGRVNVAMITGEVTYRLAPAGTAALLKEIPPKQVYDLTLTAKGQMAIEGNAAKDKFALAKPEVWYFEGYLTSIVENATSGVEAIFAIRGARWTAHYHMTFSVNRGALVEKESLVDFHQAGE